MRARGNVPSFIRRPQEAKAAKESKEERMNKTIGMIAAPAGSDDACRCRAARRRVVEPCRKSRVPGRPRTSRARRCSTKCQRDVKR
jgi:hypothetical protein